MKRKSQEIYIQKTEDKKMTVFAAIVITLSVTTGILLIKDDSPVVA